MTFILRKFYIRKLSDVSSFSYKQGIVDCCCMFFGSLFLIFLLKLKNLSISKKHQFLKLNKFFSEIFDQDLIHLMLISNNFSNQNLNFSQRLNLEKFN